MLKYNAALALSIVSVSRTTDAVTERKKGRQTLKELQYQYLSLSVKSLRLVGERYVRIRDSAYISLIWT